MSMNLAHHLTHFKSVKILLLKYGVDDVVLGLDKDAKNLPVDGALVKFTNIKSINVLNDDIQE